MVGCSVVDDTEGKEIAILTYFKALPDRFEAKEAVGTNSKAMAKETASINEN